MPEKLKKNESLKSKVPELPVYELMEEQSRYEDVYGGEEVLSSQELADQTYEFVAQFDELIKSGKSPDSIFFLLKSAAPVANVLRKAWPKVYPDTPMPKINFVDIGRKEKEIIIHDFNMDKWETVGETIDPTLNAPKQKVFNQHFQEKNANAERIMIVDEWSKTGTTIEAAEQIVHDSFPDAEVSTNIVYSKKPHWYDMPDYLGIEDKNQYELEDLAIERINRRHGTNFRSEVEISGNENRDQLMQEYQTVLQQYKDSPYAFATKGLNKDIFAMAKQEQTNLADAVVERFKAKPKMAYNLNRN